MQKKVLGYLILYLYEVETFDSVLRVFELCCQVSVLAERGFSLSAMFGCLELPYSIHGLAWCLAMELYYLKLELK